MQTEAQNKKSVRLSAVAIAAFMLVLVIGLAACSSDNTDSGTGSVSSNGGAAASGDTNPDDGQTTGEATGGSANTDGGQTVAEGESLVIQTSEISETAQFYPVTVDGTRMEVVAVEAPDGTIRTAFNTCQVCNGSPKAYFVQSDTTLQCQNCGNKFPMDRVELEAGGCNPVPIFDEDKTVTDESITIPYDTLKANAGRFPANWKS